MVPNSRFAAIVVLCASLFSLHPVFAQSFTTYNGGRYAFIEGRIWPDSHTRFSAFLDAHSGVVGIRLNSPGGNVVSAIKMADEIDRRRLSTFISESDSCASACAVLFFAGRDRLVRGWLGVHQMDDGGRGNASSLQFILASQLDAFVRFGVPWTIAQRMLTTPPWEMYWISQDEIEQLALNRDLPGDAGELRGGNGPVRRFPATQASGFAFSSYPAERYLSGTPRTPDFAGRDVQYRYYRTRLHDGARGGVNFAGHYAMVEIGCGTSCRFAFVVDLESGEVGSFPYGGEEQYQMKLLYTSDSRLLKARWSPYGTEGCVEQDLLLQGLEWIVLEKRSVPAIDGFCDY